MQKETGKTCQGGDYIEERDNCFEQEDVWIVDLLEEKFNQSRVMLDKYIKDPTAQLFLLVSGIYSSLYGSVSTSKVANYLQIEFGIEKDTVERAKALLSHEGWIIPRKKGRGWYELSELAEEYYHKMRNTAERELISKVMIDKIESQLKNSIWQYTPQYPPINLAKLKPKKQRIGWDFLTKIDEGEEDRIVYGLEELRSQVKQKYRYSYLLYSLNSKESFVKRMENIIERMTNLKVKKISIDRWDIRDLSTKLSFLDSPREGIDILFSAMPRALVISVYYYLNVNMLNPCRQRWIYNRAKEYVYDDGEIASVSRIEGSMEDGDLVIFGEVNLARFCNLEIFSDKALLLSGSNSSTPSESRINRMSRKILEELPLKNPTFGEIDYDDPQYLFNYLRYCRPSSIIVSGSRVVALGIAMYHEFCARHEKEFLPTLVIEHIHAEKFSKGVSSHNILVHSNFEEKKAVFGIR